MFARRLSHSISSKAASHARAALPLLGSTSSFVDLKRHRHINNSQFQSQLSHLQYHRLFSSLNQQTNTNTNNGIRIWYGSQTGTAQLFAHQLADNLEDEGIEDVTVHGLDEESPQEILTPQSAHLHLLLTSCAGKGEPPDNARKFHDYIMNDPSAAEVVNEDVNYAVFGLGNESAHPNNYNVVGKEMDARLEELGACRVKELAFGDDGGCIEGDFDVWMEDISKLIVAGSDQDEDGGEKDKSKKEVSLDSSISNQELEVDTQNNLQASTILAADGVHTKERLTSKKHPTLILDPPTSNIIRRDLFHLSSTESSNKFYAEKTAKLKVTHNQILAQDAGESSLREIRLSLECDYNHAANKLEDKDNDLSYTTGDHMMIYPRNSETLVNAYLDLLGVSDPHAIISETNNSSESGSSSSYPHPTGISIAETLSHCIDLGALPSPSFSRMILGRKETLDYVNEIANPRRTVIDLCHEAGVTLSLEDFLYNSVPMKPRYYSIASSSIKYPKEVHLVYRPVHYMTNKGYLREGVCTNFMSHKGAGHQQTIMDSTDISSLPALISSNPTFRLPADSQTPVLFIAGGCGVAPIKAFLEERVEQANNKSLFGPASVFMGFRSPEDEVYQDLVQQALNVGALTESEIVYSSGCKLKENQCQQMLVSDLVRLKGEYVWNHIQNDGGHVYMCGGARTFGAAVEAALLDVICEHGKMDFDEAMGYLRILAEEGRLAEDLAN